MHMVEAQGLGPVGIDEKSLRLAPPEIGSA